MKVSVAVSVAVLAVFGMLGWNEHSHVIRLRKEQADLTSQAVALGLTIRGKDGANTASKRPKRPHEDREGVARTYARDLIAFLKELDSSNKSGQSDEDKQARLLEMVERMYHLDAGQVRILIDEIRDEPGIGTEMQQAVIGFAIMTLAEDHPKTAMAIFTEAGDSLQGFGPGANVLEGVLGKWAEQNPLEALEWMRTNGTTHSEQVGNGGKTALIAGIAARDPKLAFDLIGELKPTDPERVAREIGEAARTPDQRELLLRTLRGIDGSGIGEDGKNLMDSRILPALGAMSDSLLKEGFGPASTWLETAGLQPTETEAIANSIAYHETRAETGKWLDWMATNLPASGLTARVSNLMGEWTRNDHRAAGSWLGTCKEGPAKQAAVRSYAKTVAPYDPATAAQWAETLPNSPNRAPLMDEIHSNWKKIDATAAAAFAARHGISTSP